MLIEDIKLLFEKLSKNDFMKIDNALWEDVDRVTLYVDRFNLGSTNQIITTKHIDIDFTFGEHIEFHENDELYEYILELSALQESDPEEKAIILYQR